MKYIFRGDIITEVSVTNTVIDALGGTDFVPTTASAMATMGQAKPRAYAYFYGPFSSYMQKVW